jgi:hypothetical protein
MEAAGGLRIEHRQIPDLDRERCAARQVLGAIDRPRRAAAELGSQAIAALDHLTHELALGGLVRCGHGRRV